MEFSLTNSCLDSGRATTHQIGKQLKIKALFAHRLVSQVPTKGAGVPLKSILLVNDSKFMRVSNEKALSRAGYDVVAASDGEEALQMANSLIPDLIVLDMLPPKLGGPEVLRALRKDPLTASIPVVVLSSLPQTNEARLVKEGATAYVDKSTLKLDQHSESPIQIVKRILDEQTEQNASVEPSRLGLLHLTGRSEL
jgi:twitching motility two-component system response regulator PilH